MKEKHVVVYIRLVTFSESTGVYSALDNLLNDFKYLLIEYIWLNKI